MRPRNYAILVRAVEEGVAYGLTRVHKHSDKPSRTAIEDAVTSAVVDAISEVFSFEESSDVDCGTS